MEWLQTLLDNSTTPALTALLLGLLTAVSVGYEYRSYRIYR